MTRSRRRSSDHHRVAQDGKDDGAPSTRPEQASSSKAEGILPPTHPPAERASARSHKPTPDKASAATGPISTNTCEPQHDCHAEVGVADPSLQYSRAAHSAGPPIAGRFGANRKTFARSEPYRARVILRAACREARRRQFGHSERSIAIPSCGCDTRDYIVPRLLNGLASCSLLQALSNHCRRAAACLGKRNFRGRFRLDNFENSLLRSILLFSPVGQSKSLNVL